MVLSYRQFSLKVSVMFIKSAFANLKKFHISKIDTESPPQFSFKKSRIRVTLGPLVSV